MTLFDLPEPEPDPGRFLEPAERGRFRKVKVREHERTVRMPPVDAPQTVAGKAETSKQAAKRALPRSGTDRRAVFEYVVRCGGVGATDDEIERTLGMSHQSASARRNSLAADGWLVNSGRKRNTRTGSPAAVWVLSADGRRALDAER